MARLWLTISLVAGLALAGCASGIGTAGVDSAKYERMSCEELNVAVGETATSISRTAISRGRAGRLAIPSWVLGGSRAVSIVTDRQSAKIEALQQQQAAIEAARKRRC